jgi:hypothetical protein
MFRPQWIATVVFVLGSVVGCSTPESRPRTNVGGCVPTDTGATCVRGGVGVVGGGGGMGDPMDAASRDESAAVTPVTVAGTLRLFTSLPPALTATTTRSGWTLRALPSLDPDAGTAPMIEATTLPTGEFTLPDVPPVGSMSSSEMPSFWVEATFPVMGGIGSIFEVPAGSRALTLNTVDDDLLRVTINSFGFIQSDDRAVIAVYVRESRADGARAVSDRRANADGQSSATLYDNVGGTLELAINGTGPRGFALIPNVPVPASGDGFVSVTVQNSPRMYQVRVKRGRLSWLVATSS